MRGQLRLSDGSNGVLINSFYLNLHHERLVLRPICGNIHYWATHIFERFRRVLSVMTGVLNHGLLRGKDTLGS